MNHGTHSDDIFIPDTTSDEAREKMEAFTELVKTAKPEDVTRHLFRALANLTRGLSGYAPEHLQLLLERFNQGAEAETAGKCGCPSCLLRIDFIRMLGAPLAEAVKQWFEVAKILHPRIKAGSDRAAAKAAAAEKIGRELGGVRDRGKLGLC